MSYTLVLDAMGAIFASADDVVELLQPFIAAQYVIGCSANR